MQDPDVCGSRFFLGISPYLFGVQVLVQEVRPFAVALRRDLVGRRAWPVIVECDGPCSMRLYHALRRLCPWEAMVLCGFVREVARRCEVQVDALDIVGEVAVTISPIGIDGLGVDRVDCLEEVSDEV